MDRDDDDDDDDDGNNTGLPDSPGQTTRSPVQPKKGRATASAKSSPAVRRGSISDDSDVYPTVDFDEYLKLRLGKLIEVSNYVSSSAQNLDSTSNMLEAAFADEKNFLN